MGGVGARFPKIVLLALFEPHLWRWERPWRYESFSILLGGRFRAHPESIGPQRTVCAVDPVAGAELDGLEGPWSAAAVQTLGADGFERSHSHRQGSLRLSVSLLSERTRSAVNAVVMRPEAQSGAENGQNSGDDVGCHSSWSFSSRVRRRRHLAQTAETDRPRASATPFQDRFS